MNQQASPSVQASLPIPRWEFIALAAALMALNALAIDIMLPGLQQIGASLGVENENHRQYVVTAYILGFGAAQLAFGPLSLLGYYKNLDEPADGEGRIGLGVRRREGGRDERSDRRGRCVLPRAARFAPAGRKAESRCLAR